MSLVGWDASYLTEMVDGAGRKSELPGRADLFFGNSVVHSQDLVPTR